MDDPQLSRQLEENINANMANQQMNKKTMENNIVMPDISYEGQEAKDLLTTITNDIFTNNGDWKATNITPPSNIDQRQGNNPDFMDFDVEAEPLDKVKVTLSMAQLKIILKIRMLKKKLGHFMKPGMKPNPYVTYWNRTSTGSMIRVTMDLESNL